MRAKTRDGPTTQEIHEFLTKQIQDIRRTQAAAETPEAKAKAAASAKQKEADAQQQRHAMLPEERAKRARKDRWHAAVNAAEKRVEEACNEDNWDCERDRQIAFEAAEKHLKEVSDAGLSKRRHMHGLPSDYSDSEYEF